jgi:hypothetical protein
VILAASTLNINDLGEAHLSKDLRRIQAKKARLIPARLFFSPYFYCTCFGEILGQEHITPGRPAPALRKINRSPHQSPDRDPGLCEEFLLRMRVEDYTRFLDLIARWYLKQCLVWLIPLDICKGVCRLAKARIILGALDN